MSMKRTLKAAFAGFVVALSATAVSAQDFRTWMSPEIVDAWNQGYLGQRTTITVIDDFTSTQGLYGNLRGLTEIGRHGDWTAVQASMIAPSASVRLHDFSNTRAVSLQRRGLNTLNLSYGMIAAPGYGTVAWGPREASIISYAQTGRALVVKAAGNDSVAVGQPYLFIQDGETVGIMDYLNRDLIGAQSAIFVGALSEHGTTEAPASMAGYSNIAGSNATVQNQFLVVGVTGNQTGLYGTSFAAPIVSGYAAVLGSKFRTASATQIANQLLNTARTDTISDYSRDIHGRGEASITRALAPRRIR